MKTRDIQELKNKSVAELEKSVKDAQEKLRTLRLDLVAGKVKNVSELRTIRKNVARMLTFIKVKNAAGEK